MRSAQKEKCEPSYRRPTGRRMVDFHILFPPHVMDQNRSLALPTDFSPAHWNAMKEMASEFHKAGALPPHWNSAARIVMGLQAGAEMGIPPMQALNTLYIVNGKVAMEGKAMLKKILQSGIKVKWPESTDKTCTVKLIRKDADGEVDEYEETFTMEEATKANLMNKDNWKKYPKDMLRWKALSRASRFFCPDVTEGVYTIEEMVDNEGSGARWTGDGIEVIGTVHPKAQTLIDQLKIIQTRDEYEALKGKLDAFGKEQDNTITNADRIAVRESIKTKLKELDGEPIIDAEVVDEKTESTPEKPVQDEQTAVADGEGEVTNESLEDTLGALEKQTKSGKLERDPDAPPPYKVRKQMEKEGKPIPATVKEMEEKQEEPVAVTSGQIQRFMLELKNQKSMEGLEQYCHNTLAPLPLQEAQVKTLKVIIRQRARGIKEDMHLANTKVEDDEMNRIAGF